MKTEDLEISFLNNGLLGRLDLYLAGQGMGFNAAQEKRRRLHEACALEALSDCELAYLGLTRDQIPEFVFADMLG